MIKLFFLLALSLAAWATDLTRLYSARAITVTNTGLTSVYCPLHGATVVQVYIRPSSSAQIFTLTLPDGTSVEVPSGNTFTVRVAAGLLITDKLFDVQTATGTAVLQVVGFKELR